MHVAICCITYRRPEGLRRLLEGLSDLVFEKGPAPRITTIIVDNDRGEPVSAIVRTMRARFRFDLVYELEPVQGIARARNRALSLVPADADFVAMIDDDEVPVPAWLDELMDVSQRFEAELVQGPVRPVFEAPPPGWLVRGRFLELGPYQDGAPLGFGYSGNVLMNAAAIQAAGLSFDEAFDLTGGEDQRFFDLALRRGLRIVAAERAIIWESAPPARATLRYLLRRRFRIGNTLARIDRLEGDVWRVARRCAKGLARLGFGCVQSVALAFRGAHGPIAGLCNVAWGLGTLAGLTGVAFKEYDPLSQATGKVSPPLQPSLSCISSSPHQTGGQDR